MGYRGRYDSWDRYPRYVSAGEKAERARKQAVELAGKGESLEPVVIEGRGIAKTFWGKSWCDNLESYSDYSNRLPRGRSYVRNGSVLDLKIEKGCIRAVVSGTSTYKVEIKIKTLPKKRWDAIKKACSGHIGTLVELLKGSFSAGIMSTICDPVGGMFPAPKEIEFNCSCPDWAYMCKHVAAVLYGVGARLDHKPELIFLLRDVDHLDLISHAVEGGALAEIASAGSSDIAESDISDVFGIELDNSADSTAKPEKPVKKAKSVKKAAPVKKPKTAKRTHVKKTAAKPEIKTKPRKASRATSRAKTKIRE
ncbi:MAG: SWIM zinc finger family protein [Victivallales bacterium]|nr:SWIM zinc finger family protein [Victivallales bacterium]